MKSAGIGGRLELFAHQVSVWSGSSKAFLIAFAIVIIWAATGPLFHFSDTWQLVINTGTTIATFLMVFLIQRSQNKDALALHLKLNELVAAMRGANNRLIDIEDLREDEIEVLHQYYRELARMEKAKDDIKSSHSIEKAKVRHIEKGMK